jgi:hypothetical protein
MLRHTPSIVPRSRVGGLVLLVAITAGACSAGPGLAPTGPGAAFTASPAAVASEASASPLPSPSRSARPAATAHATAAAPTVKSFWAAVSRGLTAAGHLQVTISGPNPGVLRYQPTASATLANGQIGFVCVGGAAFDGQSGFARVPGAWVCGAGALVSSFRKIGEPADSWNAASPTDAAITESVGVASDGTWTWSYGGTSVFLGGKVSVRVSLDPKSGRILTARRVDPTGTTTYAFDYSLAFPALAVPR